MKLLRAIVAGGTLLACGSSGGSTDVVTHPGGATSASPTDPPEKPGAPPAQGDAGAPEPPPNAPPPTPAPLDLVAVTFNTGMHDMNPNDAFTGTDAKTAETYYGSGLSWNQAIEDTKAWLAKISPDVIGLQEIFDPEDCPTIPADKKAGFVCETWQPGDPTVAQRILGPGYQVACQLGHHDICAAVKLSFGKFAGCTDAVCPDGLGGVIVPTCGHGGRVGRGVIELTGGGTLTLVSIHATSGYQTSDSGCRTQQFDQIFVDLDGAPAANGSRNLILGDFNTDPGRLTLLDSSAQTLANAVDGTPFHFVTEVGPNATPTYDLPQIPLFPVGVNIDHVVSDALKGSCWTAGLGGHPPVASTDYFDHKPAICTIKQ